MVEVFVPGTDDSQRISAYIRISIVCLLALNEYYHLTLCISQLLCRETGSTIEEFVQKGLVTVDIYICTCSDGLNTLYRFLESGIEAGGVNSKGNFLEEGRGWEFDPERWLTTGWT